MNFIIQKMALVFGCGPETLAIGKILGLFLEEIHNEAIDLRKMKLAYETANWDDTVSIFVVPRRRQEDLYPIWLLRCVRLEIGWPGSVLIVTDPLQAERAMNFGYFKLQAGGGFFAQSVLPRPLNIAVLVNALSSLRPYRPAAWKANLKLLMGSDEICRFCGLLEGIEKEFQAHSWNAYLIEELVTCLRNQDGIIGAALGHSARNALRPYLETIGASPDAIAHWGSRIERGAFLEETRSIVNEKLLGLIGSEW